MEKFISTKKAQVWSIDLSIALIIFSIGIITLYLYALNYTSDAGEKLDSLFYDGNNIGELLLQEDYPPGLASENRVNHTRLVDFNSIAYAQQKALFNTQYDFYFNFSERIYIGGNYVQGIGNLAYDTALKKDNVKITRFTIYNNRSVRMEIYIWD